MAGIALTFDAKTFRQQADAMTRVELPNAMRAAMRDMSEGIILGLRAVLEAKSDNPTEHAKSGFYVDVKTSQQPTMEIGVRPEQADYLRYLFEGGVQNDVVSPTDHSRLDIHGNFPIGYLETVEAQGGFWRQAPSGVTALFEPDGNGSIHAVAMQLDTVIYQPKIDLNEEVGIIVADLFPAAAEKALKSYL